MRAARPAIAAACALALAASGCGDPAPVAARNRTVGLRLDEYRIVPQVVSAPAGELRIIVRNRGRLTHNVAVETVPPDPTRPAQVIARTPTTHAGGRAEVRVVLRPGTYRLACTIANHDVLGQNGTLRVR